MKARLLSWIGIVFLALSTEANATATQEFYYISDSLNVTAVGNYGAENREAQFLNDIKKILPYILGIDKVVSQRGKCVLVHIYINRDYHFHVEVGGEQSREIKCDGTSLSMQDLTPATTLWEKSMVASNPFNLAREISKLAGVETIKVAPIHKFKGYTLQIAYIARDVAPLPEKNRWRKKIDETFGEIEKDNYNANMYIKGDIEQVPIWIHQYPDNSAGVRFGLFNDYSKVKDAIYILKLGEKHSQIIPIEFKTQDLDKFFD